MIIYNQTSTAKKYLSGILMGALLLPAIYLFTQGYIIYGIVLVIIYLAFETFRTGVDFDFGEAKFTDFREVFFIKIRKAASNQLDTFTRYRLELQNINATVSANWAQYSTVSQEQCSLALFDKSKGEFLHVVNSDVSQIQPLVIKLEEQKIVLEE